MKPVYAALLILAAFSALADVANGSPVVTWTLPTQNVDGTTIPPTGNDALKDTRLYCDGVVAPKQVILIPATTFTFPLGAFIAGGHTCQATVTTNGGAESAKSNAVNFTMPVSPPKAPVIVTIQ
jgi:hypothetical protein